MDESVTIPDIQGKVLVIQSDSLDNKYDAILALLKRMLDMQTDLVKKRVKSSLPNSTSLLDVMVLIPEALVAMVIGGKGRQINSLKNESGADIVVNQPVIGMNLRSVQIKGAPKHISIACMRVYQTMEKFSQSIENIEKTAVISTGKLNPK